MPQSCPPLNMDPKTSQELEALARNKGSSKKLATRCWIVVMAAEGISNYAIAKTLGVSRPTVIKWRQRFEIFGKEVIIKEDFSAPGRPRLQGEPQREWILTEAKKYLQEKKSLRYAALKLGLPKSTLDRILKSAAKS